jgi:hypothetical protein
MGGQGRITNGFVRIPALVRNHSAEWADVVIAVELLDADGQVLVNRAATNAGEQLCSPYAIPPGGQTYYLYLRDVERLNGQYASHRLTLSQAYAASPTVRAQVSLSSQTALKPAFDGAPAYLARGTVTSATGCAEPPVVAAGFDVAGHLLDVAEVLLYPKIGLREFGTDLSEPAAGATGKSIAYDCSNHSARDRTSSSRPSVSIGAVFASVRISPRVRPSPARASVNARVSRSRVAGCARFWLTWISSRVSGR